VSSETDGRDVGFTLGAVIAIALSWDLHHSLFWAIVHGLLGWLYVIYYVLIET
jgi:hypothetical protein